MSDISTDKCTSNRQLTIDAETVEWRSVANRAFEHDGKGDLSTEITAAIADAEGAEIASVMSPPLFEVIDIFALEELFSGHPYGKCSRACTGQVQFRYRGFRVTVSSDGRIDVAKPVDDDFPE